MDAVAQSLADPIRREILRMLRNQPMNAGEIADAFSVSRPAVSRHLRVLREAGLVNDAALGRERAFSLLPDGLVELESFIAELRAPSRWERRLMALETEVQRVRRARRARKPAAPRNRSKKETA